MEEGKEGTASLPGLQIIVAFLRVCVRKWICGSSGAKRNEDGLEEIVEEESKEELGGSCVLTTRLSPKGMEVD